MVDNGQSLPTHGARLLWSVSSDEAGGAVILSLDKACFLLARPLASIVAGAAAVIATAQPLFAQQPAVQMPTVQVIGASPLIGSGIDRNSVPAATHVQDYRDIERRGVPDLLWSLNQEIGGVSLDSASGNPFQPTFNYRGFAASPLQGRPQGLAVYVNGMRFNQPFGDTVDWDLIPNNAIDRLDVEGSNPVFGLNALGGSINVQMKNGFTWQGGELSLSGGSFGQRQGEFQWGYRNGSLSAYLAGTVLHQDGWRDLQSSDLQNAYGDLGWRGSHGELHLNFTVAHSDLNGPGTSPVQLLAVNPCRAIHRAELHLEQLHGRQSQWHRRSQRSGFPAGARLLSLLPAEREQRQCAERHALRRRRPGGPAVHGVGCQHDIRRRADRGLPERRAIRRARHAEDQHECLRRRGPGHRHPRCVRAEKPLRRGRCLRRRADPVQRRVVYRRADDRHAGVHRSRHRHRTNQGRISRSASASPTRPTVSISPTASSSPIA